MDEQHSAKRELAELGRELSRCDHRIENIGGDRRRCVKCDRRGTMVDGLLVWDN